MPNFEVAFIDLDETLYPKSNGLWRSISLRINQYVVNRLGLTKEHAQALRQTYLDQYGTTLNGLMHNHGIDPIDYLDFVHEIPIEDLIDPDPVLRQIISRIKPKKFIFTNANRNHAERVLNRLNIYDLFDGIIDIITLEYVNKPLEASYQRALDIAGCSNPVQSLIVDDRIVNLRPASEIGMSTVLVGDQVEDTVDYCIPSIHEILTQVPGLE